MTPTLERPPATAARVGLRAARFVLLVLILLVIDHLFDGMRGLGPWWQP